MQKMFMGDTVCPHTGYAIDSPSCRNCKWFYRAGTYSFIWCFHPVEMAAEPVKQKSVAVPQPERRKPGRPKKEQAKPDKRKKAANAAVKKKKR